MTSWQSFDQRKVCPKCGEYQTHVQRQRGPSQIHYVVELFATLVIFLVTLFIGLLSGNKTVMTGGIFFTALVFVGFTLLYAKKILGARKPTHPSSNYYLSCQVCGHHWEMTKEEWGIEGQREIERLDQFPPFAPASMHSTEEIPPKPAGQKNTTFVMILAIVLSLFAFIGIFWWINHPNDPAIGLIGTIAGLAFIVGIPAMFKVKAKNSLPLILVLVIVVILYALWLFMK